MLTLLETCMFTSKTAARAVKTRIQWRKNPLSFAFGFKSTVCMDIYADFGSINILLLVITFY